MKAANHPIDWRIIEPIALGVSANLLINIMLNPAHPDKWWSITEFIVAILFCIPITEFNRLIERRLDKKWSWELNPLKRFFYHLALLTLSLLFILNIGGRIYHWMLYDAFYKWNELLIINLITLMIAVLLTVIRWANRFYQQWKNSEIDLKNSKRKVTELRSTLDQATDTISLRRKNNTYSIAIQDIRMARIEHGAVKVFLESQAFYVFPGALAELVKRLPPAYFFPVNRNMVLHRESIIAIASGTYGKIELKAKSTFPNSDKIIVSRPKAAAFRKWYHSTSPAFL